MESLSELGYAIARNIFSPEEIADIRKKVIANKHTGDLTTHPSFFHLVYDHRIVNLLHNCGIDDPYYFFESSIHFGQTPRVFHRDNADRFDANAPDWSEDYQILRLGIYLQNYRGFSGGLDVQGGTHKHPDNESETTYLETGIGDIAIWNLKTLHRGNGGSELQLPPAQDDRISIFITYSSPGPHLDRHVKYLSTRTYFKDAVENLSYNQAIVDLAKVNNVTIQYPSQKLLESVDFGKNVGWKPIPY